MVQEGSGQPPDGLGCRHYWLIQPATGPVSQGFCQTCGQTREFKNYVEAAIWGDARWFDQPKRTLAEEETPEEEELLDDYEEAFAG